MATEERGVRPRRDPFSELELVSPFRRGGLGPWRLFEDFLGDQPRSAQFAPAVEVTETDDAYVVKAEIPGTKPEDVHVELHDGVLTLRGEKRQERDEDKEHVRYVERVYGSFSRSFALPQNADQEKVEAGFKDGVLTLRVPKREEAKPRTINIQAH
jgi:HSP20 family protein